MVRASLKTANLLAFFVISGPLYLYLKMEKLHNPVRHQCARVLCRDDTNHLEILPDFSISQI